MQVGGVSKRLGGARLLGEAALRGELDRSLKVLTLVLELCNARERAYSCE